MNMLTQSEQETLNLFWNTINQAVKYAQKHLASIYGNIDPDYEIYAYALESSLKLYHAEHVDPILAKDQIIDLSQNYNDFKLKETILDYSSGSRAIGFMLDNTGRLFVDVYADYKFPYDDSGIYRTFKADLNVTAADFVKILVKAADPETKTISIKDHIDPIVNVKRNILFRKLEKA